MIQLRSLRGLAAAATMLLAGAAGSLHAQGVTTGAISGVVTDQNGHPVDNAQIEVVNQATGVKTGAITRTDGRYNILGLEVGSSYSVTARRIGFQPTTQDNIRVALSEATRVDLALHQQAAVLQGVTVTATAENAVISPTHMGTATNVSDSALRRLPTLSRNFTDFVTLTPQVSTTLNNGGLSGGGVNNRFNQIMIDGASETDLFGLGSTGQPGGQANGKSIGIESVKEYQVLLSPFDVRQGNFAGLLVNAVTKSGTNEFHGSAYSYYNNQNFVRSQDYIDDFNETQYGISLGGPIVKNKAFFFINPEFQTRNTPARGVFLGETGFNLDQATVDRFTTDLQNYGVPTGAPGRVTNHNPLANVFARVDINDLPFNSSLVLRYNYGKATEDIFSRGSLTDQRPSFPLSSNGYQFNSRKDAPALQLRTHFANGAYNEFLTSLTRIRDSRATPVRGPQITVTTPNATLVAGTERSSQANELDQDIFELTDNFTLPIGTHNITIGTQNEFYKVRNLFAQNSFGVWSFSDLNAFEAGNSSGYLVGVPITGDGAVRFKAAIFAGYVQDQWTVNNRLNITGGLRVDIPHFNQTPPTNPLVLSAFNRNTADIPSGHMQFSPRLGLNWDVTGDQKNQLRGGIGLFTGHPAYVWLSNAFQNSGLTGVAQLSCNAANSPAFSAGAVSAPPTQCSDGTSAKAGGEIDLLQPNLRFPQTARLSLGYDRDLGHNIVATVEGLYTKAVYAPFYQNIALLGPQGTDAHGRVLYGMQPGQPALVDSVNRRTAVIDVSNENKDYSYNLTFGLQRRFANRWEGSVFYTFTQAKDVESLTSSTAYSNWQFGRVYSGLQSAQNLTSSSFEQPHRIVVQGSYTFPTLTTLSLIYTGSSGTPFAYVYGGSRGAGDMNGDGSSNNDPIYIPKDATDPAEMQFAPITQGTDTLFTAQQQAQGFNQFINGASCLSEQRGQIMKRNSCRSPWVNLVNLSVRQSFHTLRLQNVSVQLDIFNFLNLLNQNWGHQTFPFSDVTLVSHTGNTLGNAGTLANGQPIFQFDPTQKRFDFDNIDSNYQMQISVRYNF